MERSTITPELTHVQRVEVEPKAPRRRFSAELGIALAEAMPRRHRQSLDDNMLREEPSRFSEVVRELMRQRASQTPAPNAAEPAITVEESKDQRYVEMMERFQIRKVARSPSASSLISGKATVRDVTENPALTTASTSVFGQRPTHARNTTVIDFTQWDTVEGGTGTERASRSSRFSVFWLWVTWRRKLVRFAGDLAKPISPASTIARVRIVLLALALAVHVVVFPLKTAFYACSDYTLAHVEVVLEMVFLLDCALVFNTAYYNKRHQLVTSRRRIVKRYLRGWFTLDLLSSLPVGMILLVSERHSPQASWPVLAFDVALRSQRAVHLVRTARVLVTVLRDSPERRLFEWLMYSRFSHLLRIAWVVLCIVLIAHYLACGWKLLAASSAPARGTPLEDYVACFYDVLQLLQGQGVATTTVTQNVYATFAILIGSLLLAIVFGNVGILVSNFNANSTSYQRKMESVFAVMSKLQLPAPLRERIHQYYEHLWREYESLDGEIVAFSKGLSHSLELEVVLFKYMDLIMHVPFWRDASPDFQKQLMLSLQVRVYLPDDYIIRRGEVGEEFFMINRGVCALELGPDSFECTTDPIRDENETLVSETDASVPSPAKTSCYKPPSERASGDRSDPRSATDCGERAGHREPPADEDKHTQLLRRGQSFGEIALIMNYERTANARASSYVEMCVLHRKDFQSILIKHPKDRKEVLTALLTKTMENNEATQVWCPLRATAQSVFGDDQAEREPLSAMHAALLISTAVNIPLDDASIQFGIGGRLRDQLVELRTRQRQVDIPPTEPRKPETTSPETVVNPDTVNGTATPSLVQQVQELNLARAELTSLVTTLIDEVRALRRSNEQLRTAVGSYEHNRAPTSGSPLATASTPGVPPDAIKPLTSEHRLSRRVSTGALGAMTIPENRSRVVLSKAASVADFDVALKSHKPAARSKPVINRRASFTASRTTGMIKQSAAWTVVPVRSTPPSQLQPKRQGTGLALPALERPSPTMYADQLFERRSQDA